MIVSGLLFCTDDTIAHRVALTLLDAVAVGNHLVLSHATNDFRAADKVDGNAAAQGDPHRFRVLYPRADRRPSPATCS